MAKKCMQKCMSFLIVVLFVSCVSGGIHDTATRGRERPSGEEQSISAQRNLIEEQQRTIGELGNVIGQVQSDLDGALQQLEGLISGSVDIEAQWRAIDEFVRRVIEAKQRLIDVQQSD